MSRILINRTLAPMRTYLDNLDNKEIIISKPYFLNIESMNGGWNLIRDEKFSLRYLFGLCRLLGIAEGKKFDDHENSKLAASIDGKHRLNAVYGKQTDHSISIAIRLKRNSGITIDDFPFTSQQKEKLIWLVQNKKSILISGGTSTGKTTLLNALVKYIPSHERIITIENVSEIDFNPEIHNNTDALFYLNDSPKEVADLTNTSLRMRPDRIILGELRQENSYAFLRAANTGHEGTLSTIHANSPNGAIDALIQNIKVSTGSNYDDILLKRQIYRNLDAVVQIRRESDGKKTILKCYLIDVPKK